jgi:hypothetical protein
MTEAGAGSNTWRHSATKNVSGPKNVEWKPVLDEL